MTPLDHCAALVSEADPDRFLSAMTAPPSARARLLPLYAAFVEIARAPWASEEPVIGLMRLQFWEDGLTEICAGRPPRAHPVLEALAPLAQDLDEGDLHSLIAARRLDREPAHPHDEAALHAYLVHTAVAPMRQAARLLAGASLDTAGADATDGIGFAFGASRFLVALPAIAARGRIPLPDMAPADRVALVEGRTTPALADAVAALGAMARSRHRAGRSAARHAPWAIYPALRAAWRSGRILARARPGVDVVGDFGPESAFRRHAGLLWRQITGRV